MAFNIIDQVKTKTRDQWRSLIKDRWTQTRIWIQENGEASFLLGLFIGLMLIAFHKLVLALIALSVIACFGLYMVAPEKEEAERLSEGVINGSAGTIDSIPSDHSTSESLGD